MPESSLRDVLEHEPSKALLGALFSVKKELIRQSRMLYNHSNPVDEYSFNNGAFSGPIQWQPDYEIPERIESISASLPVGITAATLQLGQRIIPLLSVGAATTAQTLVNMNGLGLILNRDDNRILTFTGAPTTGYWINLCGHALEQSGNR